MAVARKKETTRSKQSSTPTLPPIIDRELRTRSSITDDFNDMQLSQESRNLLFILEKRIDKKFNELISILEARD